MAKTKMICPFSDNLCNECAYYRGRHYYLCFCKQYGGYIEEPEAKTNTGAGKFPVNIKTVDRLVEPWTAGRNPAEAEPDVRLRIIDMENGEARTGELHEARNWDWSNTEILRLIDGFHITSFDKLLDILHYKADKGYGEAVIYEGPRFMLLAGG